MSECCSRCRSCNDWEPTKSPICIYLLFLSVSWKSCRFCCVDFGVTEAVVEHLGAIIQMQPIMWWFAGVLFFFLFFCASYFLNVILDRLHGRERKKHTKKQSCSILQRRSNAWFQWCCPVLLCFLESPADINLMIWLAVTKASLDRSAWLAVLLS